MMSMTKLCQIMQSKSEDISGNKVTVVGAGQVGMAAVYSILTQGVTNNIVLVDILGPKATAEMKDLQQGSAFMRNIKVQASNEYPLTAGSKMCVVTAGVRQRDRESRADLVKRNTTALKNIIPQLVRHSPHAIYVIVTHPVDLMTYVAWKISGLPKHRVIGSGTNLDSTRFRHLLSEKLGIATTSCHGYIIGEHGENSVPVWSGVNIAGVRLSELYPNIGTDDDPENWKEVYENVVKNADEVISQKGFTSWAHGLALSYLVRSILLNTNNVHTVSTYFKGQHGIDEEVFMSLPCVLGRTGVNDIVRQTLNELELQQLRKSAQLLSEAQKTIQLWGHD